MSWRVACCVGFWLLCCGVEPAMARPPGWSSPKPLAADVGSFRHQVGVADDGEAVATWDQNNGVWAAAAAPGLPFNPPQRVFAGRLGGNDDLLLSVDRHGNAAIAWVRAHGPGRSGDLFLSYRGAGGRFLRGRRISRRVSGVTMAMDASEDVTLVWQTHRSDGRLSGIAEVQRGADGRLGRVQQLVRDFAAIGPTVAVNGRGDAVAVWQSGPVNASAIVCATRLAGHPFGASFQIVPGRVGGFAPNVGIDDRGTALIAWDGRYDGASAGIPFRQVWTGVVRAGRTAISRVGSLRPATRAGLFEIDPQPQVNVNRRGDALVVWEQEMKRGPDTVEVARGKVGSRLSRTSIIGRSELDGPAQAALSPSGAAIVAWDDVAGPSIATVALSATSRFGPSRPLSAKHRLADVPAVAISKSRAIGVWQDFGSSAGAQQGSQSTPLLYSALELAPLLTSGTP